MLRRAGDEHGVDDLLQVAGGDGRVAIAVGEALALLGDAEAAGDGTGRLGQDGAVGRAAARRNLSSSYGTSI